MWGSAPTFFFSYSPPPSAASGTLRRVASPASFVALRFTQACDIAGAAFATVPESRYGSIARTMRRAVASRPTYRSPIGSTRMSGSGSAEMLAAFRELTTTKQLERSGLLGGLRGGIHAALMRKYGTKVSLELNLDALPATIDVT